MLSLDDLQLLEAVRATGSLSRAAERLGKAASTVSYAARQLEDRLDALLFDRAGYRIALTPAGLLLVEQGAQLHAQAKRLTERVKQVARGWESELRIATDELANIEALLPLVADFDALNSGVRLRFAHEVLGGTWEALLDQRADLVVAATNEPPAMAHLQWFELAQLEWVFAVAPRHPLAQAARPLAMEAITAHRAVVVADTSRLAIARSYGVQTHQERLAMPSMRAKIAAQVAGLGVGWLPLEKVRHHLERGTLVALPTQDPREPNLLFVGWHSHRAGPALQWWVDKLRNPRLVPPLLHQNY
ncbi:LysR family transcriptional regulator [Rhodoferax sp.]|uniref:LysR family transcriptional regulator n=1 Tax=Rhodoferax sp. TaxID=50421 RepID=UPI0025D1791A|nr:LysR family transcriptional regulator [Rhodoferax sp.]